eukprot:TRINITY_DN4388_c0_g1_i1.p1 TRINITY_DN4388_c0_g1~~TRINITY_DN4388_c0_g1_i1.p1  ORF type:complete len:316 (-),score=54.87 TRINITY_DN4388_c0_g1_i1:227-1174(-)
MQYALQIGNNFARNFPGKQPSLQYFRNLMSNLPTIDMQRRYFEPNLAVDPQVDEKSDLFNVDPHEQIYQVMSEKFGGFRESFVVPESPPLVLVISGPSGAGKDAVINGVMQKRKDIAPVLTATTRGMREGERNGVDYIFVSKQKFEEWIETDQLLEYATVYGEYKGVPLASIVKTLNENKNVVLQLDVQGAKTIKQFDPNVVSIFITAPSEEKLVRRLINRDTENLERLEVRIQTARKECMNVDDFDYVLVNRCGALEQAIQDFENILDAELMRVVRRKRSLQHERQVHSILRSWLVKQQAAGREIPHEIKELME